MCLGSCCAAATQASCVPRHGRGLRPDCSAGPPVAPPPSRTASCSQGWLGKGVYADFFHPETQDWWADLIDDFAQKLALDGLGLRANEPYSEVDGAVDGCPQNPQNTLDNPPYSPLGIARPHLCAGRAPLRA